MNYWNTYLPILFVKMLSGVHLFQRQEFAMCQPQSSTSVTITYITLG